MGLLINNLMIKLKNLHHTVCSKQIYPLKVQIYIHRLISLKQFMNNHLYI